MLIYLYKGEAMPRAKRKAADDTNHQEYVSVLADRIRAAIPRGNVTEKRMFGGVTFLVNGNMLCTAFKQGLMVRVGVKAEAAALSRPSVRAPSKTRKMPGFVFIEKDGIVRNAALAQWIAKARAYVDQLEPKTPQAKR
jgi:TfoX/Sxy family transcriptional regulator of competence genes